MNPYIGLAVVAASSSFGAIAGVFVTTQWARRQERKAAEEAREAFKERMASMMGFAYDRETGEVDCGHDECREENARRKEFAEEMADAMDGAGGEPLYESLRREYAFRIQSGTDLHTADELREQYGFTDGEASELLVRLRREFGE